ncbi:hypothetical protein OSTOST_17315, partial [Ostertagia ostertagi]
FYEIDRWYKGRIDKPEQYPKLHLIDPTNHLHSLHELLERQKPKHTPIDIGFAPRPKRISVVKTDEERAIPKRLNFQVLLSYNIMVFLNTSLEQGTFFHNVQNLEVSYGDNAVYFGNTISVDLLSSMPEVKIESVKSGEYNSLFMVNLDGNPYEKEGEVAHWIVTNIPDAENAINR